MRSFLVPPDGGTYILKTFKDVASIEECGLFRRAICYKCF